MKVLREANALARRLHVAEALSHIESQAATFREGGSFSDAEFALRERQATLLLTLSRPREAKTILEALSSVRPTKSSVRRHLARAYLRQGEAAKALRILEQLPPRDFMEELSAYGKALVRTGRIEDGANVLGACLVRNPWLERAYLDLGRALVLLGEPVAAQLLLEVYGSGEAYRREQHDTRRYEFDGEDAKALCMKAHSEWGRGRLYEAMRLNNAALRQDPGLGAAYLGLARLSIFLARPDDAIEVLKKLPRDDRLLEVLGEAYESAGDSQQAAQCYRAALSQNPELSSVRDRLRNLETSNGSPVKLMRREVQRTMRGKTLSRSIDELLVLARGLEAHDELIDARKLILFLVRLAAEREAVKQEFLRIFDRPQDAFLRLWTLRQSKDPQARIRFEQELARFKLEPRRVRQALQGKPL